MPIGEATIAPKQRGVKISYRVLRRTLRAAVSFREEAKLGLARSLNRDSQGRDPVE